jgi:hypothetical protein
MKSFCLSSAYFTAFLAAVDRVQVDARPSWLHGVAFLGPHWFYGCATLLFCLILLSVLNEIYIASGVTGALRLGLFHCGLCILTYVVWRTGMASFNPWCTGGRLCAPREAETWPLTWFLAVSGALLVASSFCKGREVASSLPALRRSRRLPPTYVEK